DVLRDLVDAADKILGGEVSERVLSLQRVVEVRYVGLMMLVVMQMHRLLVDVRLERGVVVGQRGKFKRHDTVSLRLGIGRLGAATPSALRVGAVVLKIVRVTGAMSRRSPGTPL